MLRIVQLKSSNVATSILLRKPTDLEIKRHVLERYQQLKIQNQGIETENVQISQTTAPPPTTTIHDRNDYDIDRKSWFSMVCQRVAGWFPITDKHVKLE
ncbi:unnamed protein product [Rotaria socialis]|uniref:Uncharacterized protein n=1 Tax=Rotaria socialis TaxID=392032 RepID=A0A818MZG1_9BILA|nr:unnamed protein product [Rotaria socialis]